MSELKRHQDKRRQIFMASAHEQRARVKENSPIHPSLSQDKSYATIKQKTWEESAFTDEREVIRSCREQTKLKMDTDTALNALVIFQPDHMMINADIFPSWPMEVNVRTILFFYESSHLRLL